MRRTTFTLRRRDDRSLRTLSAASRSSSHQLWRLVLVPADRTLHPHGNGCRLSTLKAACRCALPAFRASIPHISADTSLSQIFLLPSMQPVFNSAAVALFPEVIEDGGEAIISEEIDPDDVIVDRIVCANVGQSRPRPHLIVS